MDTRTKVAFACHLLAAALLLAFGALYLLRREFMPYHADAAGARWGDLAPGLRVLLLAMLRGAGGGFLAAGVSILALLLVPFRAGEGWARLAIPAVGLAAALPALHGAYAIRRRTPARPPWLAPALGVILLCLGLALSL